MKKITKTLSLLLILVLAISCATACSGEDDKKTSVSSNQVINQSVYQMEEMMDIEHTQTTASLISYVSPNYNVDYANERLSVLRGSGIGMYFSEFLAKSDNQFEDNVLYKDAVSANGDTVEVYTKKTTYEGGVFVSLEMHQSIGENEQVSPIQIYFEYDYEAKEPTKTSIISASAKGNTYSIAVAQFNYITNVSYSYNFDITSSDIASVKSSLSAMTFDFTKLCEQNVTSYLFAKLYTETGTIDSYAYRDYGTDEISADYNAVSAFYNSVYDEVKSVCVPVESLDVSTATAKVYYTEMWTYASSKIMTIR